MKKIISIILAVLMIALPSTSVFAINNDVSSTLLGLGIIREDMNVFNLDNTATKGELAYIASRVLYPGDLDPCDTEYDDVTSQNKLSGYIHFSIENGLVPATDTTHFGVDEGFTYAMLVKAMLVAGEPEIGSFFSDDEIVKMASGLGITRGVYGDALVTNKQMLDVVYKTLTNKKSIKITYSTGRMGMKVVSKSVLADRMEVSVYSAFVEEADNINRSLTVKIESNIYDNNYESLSEGYEATFRAGDTVDINKYENAEVRIWVRDGKILYIEPDKNVQIMYKHIEKINGDADNGHTYAAKGIKNLAFIDDDDRYDTKNLVVKYNGEYTESPVELIDNFAKIVVTDKKVTYIEAWSLEEGGLITSVANKKIIYTKGEMTTNYIDLENIDYELIYINGKSSDLKQIKANSYFDFYRDNDKIVFVISEKVITEEFNRIDNDYISIGNTDYLRAEKIYFALGSNEKFKTDANFDIIALTGYTVSAYFDDAGRCRYVLPVTDDALKNRSFLAAVVNVKSASVETDIDADTIKLIVLEPAVEEKVFELSPKVKFKDNITLETLESSKKDVYGAGVFEFKTNIKGEINEISEATPYGGFGSAKASVSYFTDDIPQFTIDGRVLFVSGARIVGLYKDKDGIFTARDVSYSNELRTRYVSDTKVSVYGYEDNSDVRLVVLGGNLDSLTYYSRNRGIITGMNLMVNENDELGYSVDILKIGGLTETYFITEDSAEKFHKNSYILYNTQGVFSKNIISIESYVDLSNGYDNYNTSNGLLSKGTVKEISETTITFTNGKRYFFRPGMCAVFAVNDSVKSKKFKCAEISDVRVGETIYYNLDSYGAVYALIINRPNLF